MTEIIQIIIDHKYETFNIDTLSKGDTIPFDIYIKRYNDFVIIIKSGTILDVNLMAKLMQHEALYINQYDSNKLEDYISINSITLFENSKKSENPISDALKIREKNRYIGDLKRKLYFVYSTTAELSRHIFEKGDESLHRDALYACIREIVDTLDTNINTMPMILKYMPEQYTTHNHSTNVAFFAAILAHKIKMNKKEIFDLTYAALMHDIGKIRIDSVILNKPSYLQEDEYELVKQHSLIGYEILEKNGVISQFILNGVKHHHERLDGTGYPNQLRGKVIPKAARIIGMCDVFDALTTKRTFRKNYTSFEALILMKRDMRTQFDEGLIDIFIQMLR